VRVKDEFEPGQIIVQPRSHFLYWIEDKNKAIRYGVGVGKAGLEFTGVATIDVKKEWPTWRPTDEIIERSPKLYGKYKGNLDAMEGGPRNPLGARALSISKRSRHLFSHSWHNPAKFYRAICVQRLHPYDQ